jgi:type II secretory pathway pseudopilin PulG
MKIGRAFVPLTPLFGAAFALTGAQGGQEEAKLTAAKLQIQVIEQGLKAYRVQNSEYPEELKKLTEGVKPIMEARGLIGPWGKPYQYDAAGPKNNGKKPDVWVEAPGKKIIGNWEDDKKPQ